MNVDVTIDNLDISASASANAFGLSLTGSAFLLPPEGPKVCVELPLGAFDPSGLLFTGDVEFCSPPF